MRLVVISTLTLFAIAVGLSTAAVYLLCGLAYALLAGAAWALAGALFMRRAING